MKVNMKPQQAVTDACCKEQTKKTMKEWFAILDKMDGIAKGRREVSNYLFTEAKVGDWWTATLAVEYEIARNVKEKDGRPKGYSICSTKTIAAGVQDVFSGWADGTKMSEWLGKGTKADVKEDGLYSDADGNQGTFKRVRPDKDIRLSWVGSSGQPSEVEVMFADKGGKTGIVLNHTRIQSRGEADGLREAWSNALSSLKSLCEK